MPNPTPRAEDAPDLRAAAQAAAIELDHAPCRDSPEHTFCLKCKAATDLRTALSRVAAPVAQPGDVLTAARQLLAVVERVHLHEQAREGCAVCVAAGALRAALAAPAPAPAPDILATFRTYDHADGHTTATCDAIPDATGSGRNAHEAIGALLCYARTGLAARIAIHGDGDEDAMPDWRAPVADAPAPAPVQAGLVEYLRAKVALLEHERHCQPCFYADGEQIERCADGVRLAAAVAPIKEPSNG